jgi:predicted transcriptional regulator
MKTKSPYKLSETVEALFATAVVKIKADADKAIAKQKAISKTEVALANAGVEAEKDSILEQKVGPEVEAEAEIEANTIGQETESFEQSDTDETKSEAEAVSQKETEETPESKAEQEVEVEGAEQKPEGEEPKAEEKTKGDTAEDHIQGKEELQEAEAVSQKETEETLENDAEQEAEAAEQEAEDADAFENVEEKVGITVESQEPAAGEVSKSIQQMAYSLSNQPTEQSPAGSGLYAKDVMLKELVWGSPDDSVQQTFAKMQQHGAGYMMVGQNGVLEGIVSNSNITGALSPYLRPIFAKWRRPLDDATLQIRTKWIMSKPVRTVKPDASLVTVIGNMCQFGQRAFPVVDEQGKVQGLVTAFCVFQALLNSNPDISITGQVSQTPPLTQIGL